MTPLVWCLAALALLAAPPAAAEPPGTGNRGRLGPGELDRLLADAWAKASVSPAPPADDATFLRRATLDLAGRIPTLEEVDAFLAEPPGPDKRARLVDRLLAGPDAAEHAADLALDLFVGGAFRKPAVEARLDPRAYFRAAARDNVPYDRVAIELLTFTGDLAPGSAGMFVGSHLRGGGGEALAAATARVLLGVQIGCAQCHDHPTDARYKQQDFQALAAFFAPVRARKLKPRSGSGDGRYEIVETTPSAAPAPDLAAPTMTASAPVAPRLLGREVPARAREGRRQALARGIVASDLFAKAAVNRIWAQLFGRGLVQPADDLGGEDDPAHPPLLRRLAEDFRAGGYDLRRLTRTIALSRAYGLAGGGSDAKAGGRDPTEVFARAAVRRLTPQQLFRSLRLATGIDRAVRLSPEAYDRKLRRLLREHVFVFGDDEMAAKNALAVNIPQALLMLNGEITNTGARARPGSTLRAVLDAAPDPARRLRRLFLASYGRPPSEAEAARLLPRLVAGPDERARYEDVFFALLVSTEMSTNH